MKANSPTVHAVQVGEHLRKGNTQRHTARAPPAPCVRPRKPSRRPSVFKSDPLFSSSCSAAEIGEPALGAPCLQNLPSRFPAGSPPPPRARSSMMPEQRNRPPGASMGRTSRRKADDDVRHDVGHHHLPAAAQIRPQDRVPQYVSDPDGVGVLPDAVEGGVLIGHVPALVVDVHRRGGGRPQLQRRDGEDAAAAAQVQHPLAAADASSPAPSGTGGWWRGCRCRR